MSHVLPKDRKFVLNLILYEFIQGTPVFEAYKKFCKAMGDDFMKYRDFDFCFYRFANESYDLDYDENLKQSDCSLSDMPIEIIKQILEKLNREEHLFLRKMTRNFRVIIDRLNPGYKKISINFQDWGAIMRLDETQIKYIKQNQRCVVIKSKSEQRANLNVDYVECVFTDLMIAMRHPKLQLEIFSFSVKYDHRAKTFERSVIEKILEKINEFLKSLNHQIHVKRVEIIVEFQEDALAILPYLKPGILEEIDLDHWKPSINENKVSELDQFKQAKKLAMIRSATMISIKDCLHFTNFEIYLHSTQSKDVFQYIKILLDSTNFNGCRLIFDEDIRIDNLGNEIHAFTQEHFQTFPVYCRMKRNSRSQSVFNLTINPRNICIERYQ